MTVTTTAKQPVTRAQDREQHLALLRTRKPTVEDDARRGRRSDGGAQDGLHARATSWPEVRDQDRWAIVLMQDGLENTYQSPGELKAPAFELRAEARRRT
jgi:hypothetical protein